MRVNACGEEAGKMAESGEELGMARQATAALREETSSPLARHSPEDTALSDALNPMDAWMAAARMVAHRGAGLPAARLRATAQKAQSADTPRVGASYLLGGTSG
jgi:hypothetical protein